MLVQRVKNGHPSSVFICLHECLHDGQLLSVDPGHIGPLICCQPTTSWVHLVYCRVISCHKTNCSSSRLFSVCLYFCLAYVVEDIFLAFLFTNGKSSMSPAPSWSREIAEMKNEGLNGIIRVCIPPLFLCLFVNVWNIWGHWELYYFELAAEECFSECLTPGFGKHWHWCLQVAPLPFCLQTWVNSRTWHALVSFNHGDVWREIWVWQQLKHVY